MQILSICSRVTGILILIGSLGFFKEVKTMDMISAGPKGGPGGHVPPEETVSYLKNSRMI